MLKTLSQLVQRWQAKRLESKVAFYRENPLAAVLVSGVTYDQALAAVTVDPDMYEGLPKRLHMEDFEHDFQLLRAIVNADPGNLCQTVIQEKLPVDILLQGLASPEVWRKIRFEWIAYQNPLFSQTYPDVADLIALYKQLELSEDECAISFKAWHDKKPKHHNIDSSTLPIFE